MKNGNFLKRRARFVVQRQQNVPHILAGLSIAFLIKIYKKFIKSDIISDVICHWIVMKLGEKESD